MSHRTVAAIVFVIAYTIAMPSAVGGFAADLAPVQCPALDRNDGPPSAGPTNSFCWIGDDSDPLDGPLRDSRSWLQLLVRALTRLPVS